MPPHLNLKHLSSDELAIYNKLYPLKVALLTLKKSLSFSLTDLSEISDKVAHLAEQLASLRGVDENELGVLNDEHDNDLHSVTSSSAGSHDIATSTTLNPSPPPPTSSSTPSSRNALDALFDSTHQLVLELFAHADKVAPSMLPIYTQLIAIQSALEDMKIDACFTLTDVHIYQKRLREIELTHVHDGKFLVPQKPGVPKGQAILFAKLNACYRLANTLVILIDTLDEELLPIHELVIGIQKDLHALALQPNPSTYAILDVQTRLFSLDRLRVNNEFRKKGTEFPLTGQQLVVAIMEHCYELISELCNKKDKVALELVPLYDHLAAMAHRLAELVDHRWEVRPQDIYPYERALANIESCLVTGVFYPSRLFMTQAVDKMHSSSSSPYIYDNAMYPSSAPVATPSVPEIGLGIATSSHPSTPVQVLSSFLPSDTSTSDSLTVSTPSHSHSDSADDIHELSVHHPTPMNPPNGPPVHDLPSNNAIHHELGPAPPGQATLHYLLYKCHCHITKLQATIEPVDPSLMHIHHHSFRNFKITPPDLLTNFQNHFYVFDSYQNCRKAVIAVRKCLVELRRLGGPFAPQELYPFQLKLKSFDDMRMDGKFVVQGEAGVPAGQGALHSLLNECYDILNELKSEVEWD